MNEEAKRKRDYLKSIKTIQEYKDYLLSAKLTTLQKQILDYVILERITNASIADLLGFSESSIKRKLQEIYAILP